ncbi:MAG: CTP synthetase [Pseudomonadota bacterium]
MLRLASILYAIVATAFAGTLVAAALVTGHDTALSIMYAAAAGAVAALPATILIARRIVSGAS